MGSRLPHDNSHTTIIARLHMTLVLLDSPLLEHPSTYWALQIGVQRSRCVGFFFLDPSTTSSVPLNRCSHTLYVSIDIDAQSLIGHGRGRVPTGM